MSESGERAESELRPPGAEAVAGGDAAGDEGVAEPDRGLEERGIAGLRVELDEREDGPGPTTEEVVDVAGSVGTLTDEFCKKGRVFEVVVLAGEIGQELGAVEERAEAGADAKWQVREEGAVAVAAHFVEARARRVEGEVEPTGFAGHASEGGKKDGDSQGTAVEIEAHEGGRLHLAQRIEAEREPRDAAVAQRDGAGAARSPAMEVATPSQSSGGAGSDFE